MMFWGAFRWGKIRTEVLFNLGEGKKVNFVVYRDQIPFGTVEGVLRNVVWRYFRANCGGRQRSNP
jgi:hypothetical protein